MTTPVCSREGCEHYFTAEQVGRLLAAINPNRVTTRQESGKSLAYVEAHDVKAHLTRIFGFGRWSSEVVEQVVVCDEPTKTNQGKDAWYVAYRSVVRLTVCAPCGVPVCTFTEGHVGESTHPVRGQAHGNAVTNSESYALKRGAIALGDQFGLSLYNKGQRTALVNVTLVHPHMSATQPAADVDAETPQVEQEQEEYAAPPVAPVPAPQTGMGAATSGDVTYNDTNQPPAEPEQVESDDDLAAHRLGLAAAIRDRAMAPDVNHKTLRACLADATRKRVTDVVVPGYGGDVQLGVLIGDRITELAKRPAEVREIAP